MNEKNDGGLAHPNISLRDYLAAKALMGIIVRGTYIKAREIAERAYYLADAMLKERAK